VEDEIIYLDHNATTPVDPRVKEEMLPYLGEEYGNPSSLYRLARGASQAVDRAREQVAGVLGCKPEEVIFTGCGTEADNLAIKGVGMALRSKGNHIITSEIEHHAVLKACEWMEKQGFDVTYLGVDEYGRVSPEDVKSALRDETILVSIMHANNEVGTIQPLEEIGRLLADRDVYFHTDAVQTFGKRSYSVDDLGVDLLSLSAHKIYGPKGVGALYLRRGTKIETLLHGGGHENNRRSGTENVAGIVGLGKAAQLSEQYIEEEAGRLKKLRDRLEEGILESIDEVTVNGHKDHRMEHTLSVCVRFIEGESMLLHLDSKGVAASSGSACTSGTLDPSHVLLAMGIPAEVAHGSLRLSLGRSNTREQIDYVVEILPEIVQRLRDMSPLYKK